MYTILLGPTGVLPSTMWGRVVGKILTELGVLTIIVFLLPISSSCQQVLSHYRIAFAFCLCSMLPVTCA